LIHQPRIELCPALFTGSSRLLRRLRTRTLSKHLMKFGESQREAAAYQALKPIEVASRQRSLVELSLIPPSLLHLEAAHLTRQSGTLDIRQESCREPILQELSTQRSSVQGSYITNPKSLAERS
jgi:hypothetical protein